MAMRKVLGYVRVSTHEQVAGFGLEVQRTAIRDYCKNNSFRLVAIASDEGISGSNGLDTRPGLAGACVRIENREAAGLVVYRLDRLARDLMLQETIIEKLHAAGATVVSVTEQDIDSEEPTRVMVRQILGAVSQYERATIRQRVAGGKAAKAKAGGYTGGRPPFGFRAERGSLVEDAKEQRTIKLARVLRAERLSLLAIGIELERVGLPPRRGHWHPAQVARLIEPDKAPDVAQP